MRILFLNQYFPPDPAPTGIQLHELGEFLRQRGHEVQYISSTQNYRKARGWRMLRELKALGSIFVSALKSPPADIIFSTTSPPCLLLVATLIAKIKKARSVHWLMDMYPEIAVSLGEIPDGLLARIIRRLMEWGYQQAETVVALDEDMRDRLKTYGVDAEIIRPWISDSMLAALERTRDSGPKEPWTWIYSGNLGRAHEWKILLDAQKILEDRGLPIRLLFQGGGPSWEQAKAKAAELGLHRCEWNGYVEETELPSKLLEASLLVVTQRPEAQGLLWPSKLALILSLPRPVLWAGLTEGAIGKQLTTWESAGVFEPDNASKAARWIEELYNSTVKSVSPLIFNPKENKHAALKKWATLLE